MHQAAQACPQDGRVLAKRPQFLAASVRSGSNDPKTLRAAKDWLLESLAGLGIVEEPSNVRVLRPRKSRSGLLGYYRFMSQFGQSARLYVDLSCLRAELEDDEELWEQTKATCAHEYGHMMAEFLRVASTHTRAAVDLDRTWKDYFQGDEEAFAEDFANRMVFPWSVAWNGWTEFTAGFGSLIL